MAATSYLTRDLKREIDRNCERINIIEKNDALQDDRIQNIKDDIEDLCENRKEYERWRDDVNRVIQSNQSSIKIVVWVAAAFGVSIIGLIWALITGQAHLVFQ